MSASASLLTGKNRRRALQALIAAPLLALGIAAGPGTAHAAAPLLFTPAQVQLGGGHCSVSGWPHGTIFCGTSLGASFPNGTQEIFGIGLDDSMWTDWGTEAHPSGWQQLSPGLSDTFCAPSWGIVLSNNGDYGLEVECWDFNGKAWFDDRSDGASGGWSGWY
jgi:hypothetical protein